MLSCVGFTDDIAQRLLFTVLGATPRPTKLINFKSLKVHYMFWPIWPSSGVVYAFSLTTSHTIIL
jgi:hypothetical protein